ncbi:MAG: DUF554 domain-containing protein [Bacillota bacterium]
MIGTFVNVLAIIAGSFLGVLFRGNFTDNIQKIVMQGISLAVLLIGIEMALSIEGSNELLIVIFSLVIGGIFGELLKIETHLEGFGEKIKGKFKGQNDLFVEGFVQASLIYCVGAMAIMGAIQEGIQGDPSLLFTKSLLDGTTAIAFASTAGIGVMFSAIPVLIYQGTITLFASRVELILTPEVITQLTVTGGLLIVGIGLNILEVAKIKVGNLLPSILVVVILSFLIL